MAGPRKILFRLAMKWLGLERAFNLVVSERLAALQATIELRAAGLVQAGPFAGMRLPAGSSWGARERHLKLLGLYERDLHAAIEAIVARAPNLIVNIGCAEGYYAVGLALRVPGASIAAFDADPQSAALCAEAARANGVADRVKVGGLCTQDALEALLRAADRPAVIMDCEGCEAELLSGASADFWSHCDLLIECHDFVVAGVTEKLARMLESTHRVTRIRQGARDPHGIRDLIPCTELERWMLMDESRPEPMFWLHATPRIPAGAANPA